MAQIVVSALYKFVELDAFEEYRAPLLAVMNQHNIRGTLLLAEEGINGTVAGTADAIAALYDWFSQHACFHAISHKESYCEKMPFNRTKVKLKKEIVTLGVEGVSPRFGTGTYVKPADWNQLISADDVTVVDTRNDYEVQIGTFQHAINPQTETFREFPEFVKTHLDPKKNKKVAMFCTGGIRCEKSTAYLRQLGFEEVYHLEGGILKYLEDVPKEQSLWSGECFVFDERVAVNHDLEKGQYEQCHACRFPITQEDQASSAYVHGVSCPHCIDKHTDSQKQRYAEREKQNQLAKIRGESHIGGDVADLIVARRELKKQKQHSHS